MRILITGALGHIGSYLLYSIPKKIKCELIILDSFKTQRYSSLFNLPKNHKISFFEEDVRNINRLKNKLKHIDVVIHLAALTNAADSVGREKEFIENNFKGTSEVIKYCIKNNSKLIYISSTSIYGTQKNLVDENCSSADLKPQSPYAISKFKEEKLILSNSKASNLKMIILRFGTIFGVSKGIRFHTAVNKFCYQAAMNKKITVWKSAYNQVRPYATLSDFYQLIVFFLKEKKYLNNQTYNLVTKNLTVKDIIEIIKIKKKVHIRFVNSKIMNQLSYRVSNSKLHKIGFKSNSNLKKEIFDTLKLFQFKNLKR